jgi:hypothetical protein
MSEEFSAVMTLRAESREDVEKGVALIAGWKDPKNIAQSVLPMPANWIASDGSFSGKAVEWAYKNWGCKGCWLDGDMWWEETEPGDESNEWWACWDITSVNGVPKPILEALSKQLPELQVGYYLEGDDDDDYEVIFVNGEIDYEEGEFADEDDDEDGDDDEGDDEGDDEDADEDDEEDDEDDEDDD